MGRSPYDGKLGLLKGMASKVSLREAEDDKGRTALYLAAEKGDLEVCRFLVEESGLHVDSVSAEGRRPIHWAAAGGSEPVLRYLLDRGGDPVMPDSKGLTPLHVAAEEGHCDAVRLLLSKGVNVDAISSVGTPLYLAAAKDKDQALKILLDHGADPNKVFNQFFTPLLAASYGAHSLKCMKVLVEAGADVNFMSPDGPIILMGAAHDGLTDIVTLLLEAGADPNIPDKHGRIPIIWAAIHGKQELVELLFPRTKPIPNHMDWSVDGLIRSMKHLSLDAKGAFLEKEMLLADPKSRGKEAFANRNYFEALYLDGLDLPPPSEEITVVGSGGIGGEGLRAGGECRRPNGYRGGLLDVLEETFKYSGRGGGGLRDILDDEVNNMVAPTKLFHFHLGGHERALISDSFAKKIPSDEACSMFMLKRIPKKPGPYPKTPKSYPKTPKPYQKSPRQEKRIIMPKPIAKIYRFYKDFLDTVIRFFKDLQAQVSTGLLLLCWFGAASVSTFSTWYGRIEPIVVNFDHPVKNIVVVADDMFGCPRSRLELLKLCNLGTCDIVIPSSVIYSLKTRPTGTECHKVVPTLILIEDLLETGKVRVFQGPMNHSYKENMLRTVLILKLMYPGGVVTIATKNKLLRSIV